jgi:hypothetical protein
MQVDRRVGCRLERDGARLRVDLAEFVEIVEERLGDRVDQFLVRIRLDEECRGIVDHRHRFGLARIGFGRDFIDLVEGELLEQAGNPVGIDRDQLHVALGTEVDERGSRCAGQDDGSIEIAIDDGAGAFGIGNELGVGRIEHAIGLQQSLREDGGVASGRSEIDALAGEILHGLDAGAFNRGDL